MSDDRTPVPAAVPNTASASSADGTVLGVVSLILGLLGFMPAFGIIAAIGGIITGGIARRQAKIANNPTGRVLGTIGLVCSWITLIVAILGFLFLATFLGMFATPSYR